MSEKVAGIIHVQRCRVTKDRDKKPAHRSIKALIISSACSSVKIHTGASITAREIAAWTKTSASRANEGHARRSIAAMTARTIPTVQTAWSINDSFEV